LVRYTFTARYVWHFLASIFDFLVDYLHRQLNLLASRVLRSAESCVSVAVGTEAFAPQLPFVFRVHSSTSLTLPCEIGSPHRTLAKWGRDRSRRHHKGPEWEDEIWNFASISAFADSLWSWNACRWHTLAASSLRHDAEAPKAERNILA